jgi:hypothetical protein
VELRRQLGDHLEAALNEGVSFRRFAVVFCLALSLASVPLFSTVLPPILDYPNHLARMHILAADGGSEVLNQFYRVRWAMLPNLAMDLIVPSLSALMPLELAGKLFLVLIFAVMTGGAVWLHRVLHGRWSYWPLAAFLLLYNRVLLWGFLNYLFGLGLALGGLALWLTSVRWPARRQIAASSAVALAVYFSHISAFGIYALLLAGAEIDPAWALLRLGAPRPLARRLSLAGAQFVLPAMLMLLGWQRSATGTIAFNYWRKPDLLFSIFDNYDRRFDVACFTVFVGLLLMLAFRRQLRLAPIMRWPLALVTAAYLLLPSQLMSGSGADHRLPIALFLILVAASAPRPANPAAIYAGMVLLFLARLAMVERVWVESDRLYQQDIEVLDILPRGARVALAWPGSAIQTGRLPELHLPLLAIARSDAFVPTLFAYATQQPVALTPKFATLADAAGQTPLWTALVERREKQPEPLVTALKSYDFIIFIDRTAFDVPQSACLSPIRTGGTFQLFAINPGCAEWR